MAFNLTTTDVITTNRTRVNIYKESDPLVVEFSQFTDPVGGVVPETTWTFVGLIPGENYFYRWIEVNGSEILIQQFASQHFTVPSVGTMELRAPEDIIVGVTAGLTHAATTYTNSDWIGWEAIPERIGYGTLDKDDQYGYDITTGELSLHTIGDQFNDTERFHITFLPKVTAASNNIIVRDPWSGNLIITTETTLTATDVNKNVIIKGEDGYLKITLPDIFTVPENRLIYFDSVIGYHKCAEIECAAGNSNLIEWPQSGRNSLYVCQSESFALYREKIDNSTSVWRVKYPDGNYKTVGTHFSSYADADDFVNARELNGDALSVLDYARLYNDYVLRQNSANLCAYADWSTGNNKYKYSLSNGSVFRLPDLRGVFTRSISGSRKPGEFEEMALQSFELDAPIAPNGNLAGSLIYGRGGASIADLNLSYSGTETRPANVGERLFVMV